MTNVIKHYLSGKKLMTAMDTAKFCRVRNANGTLFDTDCSNRFSSGALIKIKTKYGMEYRWFENELCAMDYLRKAI